MTNKLSCTNYDVRRECGRPVLIRADFILRVSPRDIEAVAESLKQIELLLAGTIDLVRSDAVRPRCSWCGVLNDEGASQCDQCGGTL